MLSGASILNGAALSAVVAGTPSPSWPGPPDGGHRRRRAGHGRGTLGWNPILRATYASQFFTDAPLRLLPAS
jgi:hypothetical protein